MVNRKIKIITRTTTFENLEEKINEFLKDIQCHNVKNISVYETYAVIDYI